MKHTYLFYDIETTGLNKCFDQVLQFAAIRTDLELNELERYSIDVQLNPDVIPAAGAIITHRIGVEKKPSALNEFDAMTKIHQLLNTPGTISCGYNTLGFDDEFLRFGFYRNLLSPYTHQFANQCSRMDIYPILVMYYLFKPEILNWPSSNGKTNLKLENLSHENQLATGQAHDALVDVEATLALAQKLFQEKVIWDYMLGYFSKQQDLQRMNKIPICFEVENKPFRKAILINGKLGNANNYSAPVLSLGQHYHYKNQSLWLRLDQDNLQATNESNFDKNLYITRKKIAEQEFVLPPLERYTSLINSERIELAEKNLKWLQNNPELLNKLCDYYQNYTYPKLEHLDVDAALYDIGFSNDREIALFEKFHQALPENKSAIAAQFPSRIRREQAIRILGRHYPQHMSEDDNAIYSEYLTQIQTNESDINTTDYRGEKRRTSKDVLQEIDELKVNHIKKERKLDDEQLTLLDDLQQYLLAETECCP